MAFTNVIRNNLSTSLRFFDPVIIEKTIGLLLGPYYSLAQIFHFAPTNKAVGTIWQELSKPPQRRQGPDPRPLWLLVGTTSVLGPELASRQAEHSLLWRMSLHIFDILFFLILHVCVMIFMASLVWLAIGPRSS